MKLIEYLRLIKFYAHWSFFIIIVAALLFSDGVSQALLKSLVTLYFSFNVFLYGGIYTINGIADMKSDAETPLKRKRPLPSGKISSSSAKFFAVVLISLGLFTGFSLFNISVFYLYVIFISLNLFYTFIAKRIPYLDILGNAAPHPLRIILAFFVVGNKDIPYLMVAAYFFLSVALTCIKRLTEKETIGWKARSVLKHYTKRSLMLFSLSSFAAIIALFAMDQFRHGIFYLGFISSYLALLLSAAFFKRARAFFCA